MQGSPSSTEAARALRHGRLALGARACVLLTLLALAAGCATVRPQDKEHLAEPAMRFGNGGVVQAHEAHVLQNREGSLGGSDVRGGGCGCN